MHQLESELVLKGRTKFLQINPFAGLDIRFQASGGAFAVANQNVHSDWSTRERPGLTVLRSISVSLSHSVAPSGPAAAYNPSCTSSPTQRRRRRRYPFPLKFSVKKSRSSV